MLWQQMICWLYETHLRMLCAKPTGSFRVPGR